MKARVLVLSKRARSHLVEIAAYMDVAAPNYTVQFIANMLQDFQNHAALGLVGSPLDNIALGYKGYISGKYVALVKIFEDEVYVIGVYHTARSIAVLLEDDIDKENQT